MAKETIKQVEIYEFHFFLDAWLYCEQNKLDWQSAIKKKDFRTWIVMV
jgi:hypothetical protein